MGADVSRISGRCI
jgi:hypothetical protein